MKGSSVWGAGQLLAFSGVDGITGYDSGLCLRTVGGQAAMDVKLPGAARLVFCDKPPEVCDLASDWFVLETESGTIRGVFADAWNLLLEGAVTVEGAGDELEVQARNGRVLLCVKGYKATDVLDGDLDELMHLRRCWVDDAVERLGLTGKPAGLKALRQLKGQVYAPEGIFKERWTTPDRWPHQGCWLWDSAFHAIGARHAEPALARDAISAMFDGQHSDGMVPIRLNPGGETNSIYTQPPTLVLAAWQVMQTQAAPDWLLPLLPKMKAYLEWDIKNRDGGNGLPCWAIEPNPGCRSGESGLDNSPRFDAATRMEAVDFAAFLALEWELLGLFYEQSGDQASAAECAAKHAALCKLIRERLWHAERNLFVDYDLEHDCFCPVSAVTGFLPLICAAATEAQAGRLAEHLENPDTFGTVVPLPSVARTDAAYRPDMWCGPVWVNMAWLIAAGFERYGLSSQAVFIRQRMTAEVERWHAAKGTLFEFFDADGRMPPDELHRKGRLAPEVSYYHQCFHDYGWTGTLYLDMLVEQTAPRLPSVIS